MFRGSSFHTIDNKGRIIIPARFRSLIDKEGDGSVMITRMDDCLFVYCMSEWIEVENKILQSPKKSQEIRRFQRVFIGSCQECKCDKQGRVLIPPTLKEYAKLKKEIALVGAGIRFEIWSRENWDRENAQMDIDMGNNQVMQDISELGL